MLGNIIRSVFTKGLIALINFSIFLLSAKYLGSSSRGEISILVLNISVIQIINEVFTGYSLVYFLPRFDTKKIFIAGIFYTLIATSLGNSMYFLAGKLLPGYEWLSYAISLMVILNTFNCVIILGKEKMNLYNFLSFFQPMILLAGIAWCIFVNKMFTLEVYLYPMLISFVAALPVSLTGVVLLLKNERVRKQEFNFFPVFRYGLICQLGVLMFILSNKFSYYLLPSKAEVGIYNTSCSLIESIMIIANGISPVLLARVANNSNDPYIPSLTLSLAKWSLLISGLGAGLMFVLPESFYISLLGNGYNEVKQYMMIYAPGILLMSFISIINHYFSGIGKLKNVLYSNFMGFACTLILAPVLVRQQGMKGAAITANISYLITAVTITCMFMRMHSIPFVALFNFRGMISDVKGIKKNSVQSR